MVEIGYDILKIGIKYLFNKWKEKEIEIKERIDQYLRAAAKDGYIENVEAVFIKPRLIELVDVINELFKTKKDLKKIEECSIKYIKLLEEICQKISYEHLSKVLSLKTDVDYEKYGKLKITNEYFDIANIYLYLFEKSSEIYFDISSRMAIRSAKKDIIIIENWEKKLDFIKKSSQNLNKIPKLQQEIKDLFNALIDFNKGQLYYGQGCFIKYYGEKENFLENIENSNGYFQRALHYLRLAEKNLIGLFLTESKSLIFSTNFQLNSNLANYYLNKTMIVANKASNNNEISKKIKKEFKNELRSNLNKLTGASSFRDLRNNMKIVVDDISEEMVNQIYNLDHNHKWDDKTIEKYEEYVNIPARKI